MILDATAGNRAMWQKKQAEPIIYIDIEKRLQRKPTIFADNTNTPFLSKSFSTIFYDPPHSWRSYTSRHSYPSKALLRSKYPSKKSTPQYYGWDKYDSRQAIIKHIHLAQVEFQRILKDDGLLWFKWSEVELTLRRVLVLFDDWIKLMILYISDPTQTAGNVQTYWVCLCKKNIGGEQTRLN